MRTNLRSLNDWSVKQTIDGKPREDFIPDYLVTDQKGMVKSAVKLLKGKN